MGLFRGMKRGFNIMERDEIEEKIARKLAAMYESDLECCHSRKKGYPSILSYFVQ